MKRVYGMQLLYIDESGSMNNNSQNSSEKVFIISVIHVKNKRSLQNSFKRFIIKNLEELKKSDKNNNQMFDLNGKFRELKGSSLTPELKIKFLDHICYKDNLKVYYVKVHNRKLKDSIVKNKEVAFNFILEKLLSYKFNKGFLPNDKGYHIHLDQRNLSTNLKYTLEHFLIRTLMIEKDYISDLNLTYHDSENVRFIQIADFFANLFYSNEFSYRYKQKIEEKRRLGYISHEYNFPYNK